MFLSIVLLGHNNIYISHKHEINAAVLSADDLFNLTHFQQKLNISKKNIGWSCQLHSPCAPSFASQKFYYASFDNFTHICFSFLIFLLNPCPLE